MAEKGPDFALLGCNRRSQRRQELRKRRLRRFLLAGFMLLLVVIVPIVLDAMGVDVWSFVQ